MKFLVIVLVVVVLAGAVWLRMLRQPGPSAAPPRPHRIDDAVTREPRAPDHDPRRDELDPPPPEA